MSDANVVESAITRLENRPVEVVSQDFSGTAWFYEFSSYVYSTGQIAASKASQIKFMKPGEKVLYLGVGAGEDAILAARMGVDLTCIDYSDAMICRLRKKLDHENIKAKLIVGDALNHDLTEHYDTVCTNYFLNCFEERQMLTMMQHATNLVRPGGRYMIADVALPQGSRFARQFNRFYLRSAMISFWILGLVPLHPNYNYAEFFDELNLKLDISETFRFLRRGPVLFQNWVAIKDRA